MKNIEKMREIADNAQARADKRKFSLHVEEARQIEAAEKEIGKGPLAILPTLPDAAREPFLAALTPTLTEPDLAGIVAALHGLIKAEVERLARLDTARRDVKATRMAVAERLGPDPEAHTAEPSKRLAQCSSDLDLRETRVVAVKRYQADESGLLALFGFQPPIARKRILRARLAVAAAGGEIDLSDCKTPTALEERLVSEARDARDARDAKAVAAREGEKAQRLRSALRAAETDWHNAVSALGAPPTTVDEADALDRFLDCETRFTLFLLATRYWEGRWLLAMEDDLPGITASQKKSGRKSAIPRWQRRMMQTPCAVATFATLPGRMSAWISTGAGHGSRAQSSPSKWLIAP